MVNGLLRGLTGLGFLLFCQAALADGPCPDGNFNPYNRVCMCPKGGYVAPGNWCEMKPVPKTWGAIAIDMSSKQTGWGYGSSEKSQADANEKALGHCQRSTCRVALTFRNACGAIAADGKGIWGGGVDLYQDKALQKAADACYDKGAKNCKLWVKPMCAAAPRQSLVSSLKKK